MTLSDVTFTEARTISGKKVNLIVGKGERGGSPSPPSSDRVRTVVLEESKQGYIEGLQHVVASESPVKRVSDIVIKPKVGFSQFCGLYVCSYFADF